MNAPQQLGPRVHDSSNDAFRPQSGSNPFLAAAPDSDEIDIGAFIAHLLDSWPLILGISLGVTLAAVIYALCVAPKYRAEAMIQVEDKNSVMAGLKDLSDMFSGTSVADTEIQLLESRSVLGPVIDKFHLTIEAKPKHFPMMGGALARHWEAKHDGLAPAPLGITRWAWGGEEITITQFDVPPVYEGEKFTLRANDSSTYELKDPDGDVVLTGHIGRLEEADVPGSDFSQRHRKVQIYVSGIVAHPGTRFSVIRHTMADTLDDLRKSLNVEEQGKDTGIIGLELKGEDPDKLIKSLNSIGDQYLLQNVEQKSAEADKTLKFVEGQLPELKAALDKAEMALNDYQSKSGTIDLKLETQAVLDQSVEIEKRLSELTLEKAELVQRFTPNHPSVVALDRQIAEIEHKKEDVTQQLKKLPDAELKSVQLMRDVQVANDLYVLLLNKSQELRILKSGTVGNVRIVDSAVVDESDPVWPKMWVCVLGGIVLGLLFGGISSGILRALERGIDDPDVLEQVLGLPVYATVPHSRVQKKLEASNSEAPSVSVLAQLHPKDVTVESIRSLRTSLQFALTESKRNVIMIAGLRPQVGKSFLTANLGAVIAAGGQRVLIIDGDLRRGVLHKYVGLKREPGLSEVAAGRLKMAEVIQQTEIPNVWALTTGTLPPNPSELLLGENFRRSVESASKDFDVVLIDAPPILAVTDSALIGSHVGVTLLVIKAGTHPKREINLGLSRFHHANVRVAGFVLNGMRRHNGAYSYGRYGYSYHYEYS